jgi:hypothetical protein
LKAIGARLASIGLALGLVVSFMIVSADHARADIERSLLEVGDQLVQLEGPGSEDGGERTLSINAHRVILDTGTVDAPIEQVLGDAAERCGGDGEGVFDAAVGQRLEDRGFVGCFPELMGRGPEALADIAAALASGGDLTGLGSFDYTYARTTPRGTHVVRATFPSLDVAAMFPAAGDAPGKDVPGVPRPPDSRRVMSSMQLGSANQLVVYAEGAGTARATLAMYRATLGDQGWTVNQGAESSAVLASRGNTLVVIVAHDDAAGVSVTIGASVDDQDGGLR